MKDLLGNEITDPFYLEIRQRLVELKKRNRGRKHFSVEDNKELDAISEELDKHWKILKEEIDKIPRSEQARRMRTNLDKYSSRLFDFSIDKKRRRGRQDLFDISIFDKKTLYKNRNTRKVQINESD